MRGRSGTGTNGPRWTVEGHVHEDDEHAVARIRRHVEAGALRHGIAPFGVRRERVELEEVERIDLLRLAVLEDLEVLRREPLDDLRPFSIG